MTLSPCAFVGVVVCLVQKQRTKQGAPLIVGKMRKLLIVDICMISIMSSYALMWNI